jgi:hypothetical protein
MSLRLGKSAILLLVVAACGGTGAPDPAAPASPVTGQAPGVAQTQGGGGSGGGTQIPPPPTIDGASWFISNASAVLGTPPTPDVNFGALQNTVQGAIPVGTTRTAALMVYNTSKKTPLVISEIAVAGANAGDFSVSQASVDRTLKVPIPANKSAAAILQLAFTATAEGVRTATLRLVSNAGTALVSLSGAGLPDRPILATSGALTFLPASAFDTVPVTNQGGATLVVQSIELRGANPGSFQIVAANRGGFSNCFAGIPLGPHGTCYIGVGLAPGAAAPSSGLLVIQSNDPMAPQTAIPLELTPAP